MLQAFRTAKSVPGKDCDLCGPSLADNLTISQFWMLRPLDFNIGLNLSFAAAVNVSNALHTSMQELLRLIDEHSLACEDGLQCGD